MRKLLIAVFTWTIAGMAQPTTPVVFAGASGPARISFLVWGDPAEKKAYEALVAGFSAKHPGITVDLVYTPSQTAYYQRIAVDFAAGAPSDVFLGNYRRYAHYAANGLVEPLDDWLAKSRIIKAEDFYPEAMKPFRWNGKLVAIPQNISSLVVYYNKNLFDAAGLPYPKADWTWDEFVATAKALTKDIDGDGITDQFGLGTEATIFRVTPFIWQNGGELTDDPDKPGKLTLDAPATKAALSWFIDLQIRHHVVPDRNQEKAEPSESRFLRGTLAMFFNSRRGVTTYRDVKAFDWDVAPLPRGKHPAGILHTDAFFMAAACRNKAAAWTFIEYSNSPEGQTILARTGRTVPSLKAVAESAAFLDPENRPKNSRVFLDVIPYVRGVPVMEFWPDIENQVGQEVEHAFHAVVPLDDAIRLAIERTAEFFKPPR